VSKKIKIGILTAAATVRFKRGSQMVTKTALDRQSEQERDFQYEVVWDQRRLKGLSFTDKKELEEMFML